MKLKYILPLLALWVMACQNSTEQTTEKQLAKADLSTSKDKSLLHVGVFDGNGAGAVSVIETIEALKIDKGIEPYPISAAEIMNGKLDQTDVLIFPGGSGSKQLNNLGRRGQEKVKRFVREGKGLIGICAGAYMLCSTPTYPSLKLGDVKHLDRAHYNRGRGLIEFKLNDEGLKIFPEFKGKPQFIQYYDGPIMQALGNDKSFTPLAVYVSDIHASKGAPEGLTPGKLFMYHQNVGKGRIFAIGGHAESTPGIRFMIPRMARWVAGKELVSYDKKWIVPEKNSHEIIFDNDLKKKEKDLWWKLLSEDAVTQITAMDSLYAMRSRPAVRWNTGLLRDDKAAVRKHAARLLQNAEYTDAYKDLQAALKTENNPEAKDSIRQVLEFLTY